MFDKDSFQWFLSKSITLYCKSVLPNSSFRVDVMIGVTVNDADVATLICFSESIVRSETTLEASDINPQNAIQGGLKREDEDEPSRMKTSSGGDNLQTDYNLITNDKELVENKNIQAKLQAENFEESNYPKHESQPKVKHELQDNSAEAAGSGYDEDCYVEEPDMENGDVLQESYNQESWNEGEWNDPNYMHAKTNPNDIARARQPRTLQKPNRRNAVQRVKINHEQAMESYGRGMLPSSSEYNNLMHDICTSMVNQSTEFSKRKNGIQGNLSSASPVTCHICHATLSNTLCLRNHIQGTHLALKLKKCNLCGETFKWPMQLARHKKRVHGGGNYFNIYNA